MEHFNIKKYENLDKDNDFSSSINDLFYKSGNERIRIILGAEIQVETREVNSPYKFYKVYFSKSLGLKATGNTFYGLPVGTDKMYNEQGKLLKEINHELPYKFSIVDLRDKLIHEYDVDIVKGYNLKTPDAIKIGRSFYENAPSYYQVGFQKNGKYVYLEIDGTTGEYKKKDIKESSEVKSENINSRNK